MDDCWFHNLSIEDKVMLGHAKLLLEKQILTINSKFDKLIT
jgi:hypothetical protein